jgi:hypothetical protein
VAVPIIDVLSDDSTAPVPTRTAVREPADRVVIAAGFVLAGVVGYLIGVETMPTAPPPASTDAETLHPVDHRPAPVAGRPLAADSAERWYEACLVGLPVSADAHERATTACW